MSSLQAKVMRSMSDVRPQYTDRDFSIFPIRYDNKNNNAKIFIYFLFTKMFVP